MVVSWTGNVNGFVFFHRNLLDFYVFITDGLFT